MSSIGFADNGHQYTKEEELRLEGPCRTTDSVIYTPRGPFTNLGIGPSMVGRHTACRPPLEAIQYLVDLNTGM